MWLYIKYNHKSALSECAHTVPLISGILHTAAAVRWPFQKTECDDVLHTAELGSEDQ